MLFIQLILCMGLVNNSEWILDTLVSFEDLDFSTAYRFYRVQYESNDSIVFFNCNISNQTDPDSAIYYRYSLIENKLARLYFINDLAITNLKLFNNHDSLAIIPGYELFFINIHDSNPEIGLPSYIYWDAAHESVNNYIFQPCIRFIDFTNRDEIWADGCCGWTNENPLIYAFDLTGKYLRRVDYLIDGAKDFWELDINRKGDKAIVVFNELAGTGGMGTVDIINNQMIYYEDTNNPKVYKVGRIYNVAWGGPDDLIALTTDAISIDQRIERIGFFNEYFDMQYYYDVPFDISNYTCTWDEKDSIIVFTATDKVTKKSYILSLEHNPTHNVSYDKAPKFEFEVFSKHLNFVFKGNNSIRSLIFYNLAGVPVYRNDANKNTITWQGTDSDGIQLASGIYFARAEDEHGNVSTVKVVLVR